MQAACADLRLPGPCPENPGTVVSLQTNHHRVGTLHNFAQNMAENIIQTFMSKIEKPEVDCSESSSNQDQEMLAEELASAVIEVAVKKASKTRKVDNLQNSQKAFRSSFSLMPLCCERGIGGQTGRQTLEGSLDMDPDPSSITQACSQPLSQSGLPAVGSLDYPDAPPSTPLLPELIKSRESFIRKLKGGLAKEFLPSPPPPTPNDKQEEAPTDEPGVDFMQSLIHSLSAGCTDAGWRDDLARAADLCGGGNDPVGPQGAKMMAFAKALSADIINRVTHHYYSIISGRTEEQIDDDCDVALLAHQLANTIITSSMEEVEMLL